MKKLLALLLVLALCLSLCSCGKSEAVKAAEDAIAAIGSVTLNSKDAIEKAEKLYGVLTESEKEQVSNRLALIEAREKLESLQKSGASQAASTAYNLLNKTADLCISGMDDIYAAWYFGIYKASDYSTSVFYKRFAENTPNLTQKQLENAANALGLSIYSVKGDWQNCLYVAEMAIESKGDYSTIKNNLATVENRLKELTSKYGDNTYCYKLKEYYSAVSSYADFFMNPSGSFKQLSTTIDNYETSIRTCRSEVGVLF